MIQWMLAIWSLVPLPFLKPAWTSGISQFTYCWSLAWRILSITLLANSWPAIWIVSSHILIIENHVSLEDIQSPLGELMASFCRFKRWTLPLGRSIVWSAENLMNFSPLSWVLCAVHSPDNCTETLAWVFGYFLKITDHFKTKQQHTKWNKTPLRLLLQRSCSLNRLSKQNWTKSAAWNEKKGKESYPKMAKLELRKQKNKKTLGISESRGPEELSVDWLLCRNPLYHVWELSVWKTHPFQKHISYCSVGKNSDPWTLANIPLSNFYPSVSPSSVFWSHSHWV